MKKQASPSPYRPFRILLVDDNQRGLSARKSVLQDAGYIVVACAYPEEALLEFSNGEFDLIITDYRMPEMNGVQLIAKVREIQAAVRVVLISSVVDVLGLNESNTGANMVVPKTASEIPHLLRAVSKLLGTPALRKPPVSQERRTPRSKAK